MTGLDVDESANGYTVPGGFRNNAYGIGVAAETRARPPASGNQQPIAPRTITIDHTRIEKYNAVGVLIDAATTDYSPAAPPAPLKASGVPIQAILIGDQIAGRNSCQHYNDFTAGTPPVIVGNCQASGGGSPIPPPLPLTTGPLFGQDGVRVTAGASVQMSDTTISSNFVHGQGAPVASVFAPTPNNDPYSLGNHAENNANLRLGAGVRLVGAAASSITKSNIVDNAFGVLNTAADGVTNNSARPVQAQDNWWGRADGRADAADSRTGCVAERRRAVADDLQPAHPREPGQRQPRRERGLPGGCLRFRLGQVLPLPLEHAVRPARRRVPDRGRADRDERPDHLCERDAARPEHPDLRRVLQHRPRRPGHR